MHNAAWCDGAAAALAHLAEDVPGGLPAIRATIEANHALLWRIDADGRPAGYIVTRLEAFDQAPPEFVIWLAAARISGFCITSGCLPIFESIARRVGCAGVRIHTARRGLMRKLSRLGYAEAERVFFKGVAGG